MTKGKLSTLIDNYHSKVEDDSVRDYIGASSIGSDCLRQIWYEFNGFKGGDVDPKLRRTWHIGKTLEFVVLDWLRSCDLDASESWLDLRDSELPYFRGHVDSMLSKDDEPIAILEIKTAKDSSFAQFVKAGLKKWMPKYYAQVQAYMGMSGIHTAHVLVLNKNNSELFDEEVSFDEAFYESLKEKAKMIYEAKIEPPRINGSPIWFQCKMCKFREVCHG